MLFYYPKKQYAYIYLLVCLSFASEAMKDIPVRAVPFQSQQQQEEVSNKDTHRSKHIRLNHYKTKLCKSFETGNCKYGDKCTFSHGREELEASLKHPKYKTIPCRHFSRGSCIHGEQCNFLHVRESPSTDISAERIRSGLSSFSPSPPPSPSLTSVAHMYSQFGPTVEEPGSILLHLRLKGQQAFGTSGNTVSTSTPPSPTVSIPSVSAELEDVQSSEQDFVLLRKHFDNKMCGMKIIGRHEFGFESNELKSLQMLSRHYHGGHDWGNAFLVDSLLCRIKVKYRALNGADYGYVKSNIHDVSYDDFHYLVVSAFMLICSNMMYHYLPDDGITTLSSILLYDMNVPMKTSIDIKWAQSYYINQGIRLFLLNGMRFLKKTTHESKDIRDLFRSINLVDKIIPDNSFSDSEQPLLDFIMQYLVQVRLGRIKDEAEN